MKMPKYVVISNHPPMSCPSANRTLREIGNNLGKEILPLMEKSSIKPQVVLHLDPGHKVLWLLDAPSAESVRDFFYEGGFNRWNDFEFYMTSSLEEIAALPQLPAIW